MSDEIEVVRLAVMAAGTVNGDPKAWRRRIAELAPEIAAMMRPPQAGKENDPTGPMVSVRKVLEASPFRAEYVSWELEESSKRMLVKFRSETTDSKDAESDGTEVIRSEPMWSEAGRVMRRKVEALTSGDQVVVFKHLEPMAGKNKNVRILAHLDVLGSSTRTPDTSRTGAARSERAVDVRGEAAGPAPAASHQAAETAVHDSVKDRYEALAPRQRVAFAALCRGHGVTSFMNPGPEDLDKVLLALSNVEKGGR